MTWAPKCPRCGALELTERESEAETYEGPLLCTHECRRCHAVFRVTPPVIAQSEAAA